MTAPSAVLLILVVLSSCEVVVGDTLSVVVVEVVFVGISTLSLKYYIVSFPLMAAVVGDCVTLTK